MPELTATELDTLETMLENAGHSVTGHPSAWRDNSVFELTSEWWTLFYDLRAQSNAQTECACDASGNQCDAHLLGIPFKWPDTVPSPYAR